MNYNYDITNSVNIPNPRNQQSLAPKIYLEPQVETRLDAFRNEYCPNVTPEEMVRYIRAGEGLEDLLSNPNVSIAELKENGAATPQAAVALMWLLTAKAAKYDQLYTSGGIRLAEGEKVRDFLKACGGTQIYGRISTHFQENMGQKGKVKADNPQWGFDLRGMGLPARKHTLLFALQPDGTLFLKMEEEGCPPFWKKGFRTLANFIEFIGHTLSFIWTRFAKKPGGMKATRKEHVPKAIKKEFEETMHLLFPPLKRTFFNRKKLSHRGQQLYKEGAKYGISRMQFILEEDQKNSKKMPTQEQMLARNKMLKNLKARTEKAPSGYNGEMKGEEVLIPPLGT